MERTKNSRSQTIVRFCRKLPHSSTAGDNPKRRDGTHLLQQLIGFFNRSFFYVFQGQGGSLYKNIPVILKHLFKKLHLIIDIELQIKFC